MEIWQAAQNGKAWEKTPFGSFPDVSGPGLLIKLLEHAEKFSDFQHLVVFSPEEERELEQMADLFLAGNPDASLRGFTFLSYLLNIIRENGVLEIYPTYVPENPDRPLISCDEKELRLAIQIK